MRAEQLNAGDLGDLLELTLEREAPEWLNMSDAVYAPKLKEDAPAREVFLRHSPEGRPGLVMIHRAGGREQVRATAADDDALHRVLGMSRQAVTWVAQAKSTSVFLHVHVFGKGGMPGEGLLIGVDDDIADRVRDHVRNPRASFEEVRDWLRDQFSMPGVPGAPARQVRIVHSSTPAADGGAMPDAFSLIGGRWVADVTLRDDRLRITRLVGAGNRRGQRWPVLSHTALSFVAAGTQQATSEEIRAALAGLIQEGKSYLELWRAYDELEWQVHVHDALDLGVPRYGDWRENEDGTWNFSLERRRPTQDFLRRLQLRTGSTELEAAEHIPAELTGEGRGGQGRSTRGTVERVHEADWSIDIRPPRPRGRDKPEPPPPHGVLFLSLSGSRVSQDRRLKARDRIWSGTAEMRGLAQLIEGVGIPLAEPRSLSRYRKTLDRVIRESFESGEPTDSQREALRLALQTPDLLVVQGPPGTGKTQFIAALLRCLDATGESARAFGRTPGTVNRTLLTSYQHDAVDNMVRKTLVRGLPPTRVDNNEDRALESARDLRAKIVQRVQQPDRRPRIARGQRLRELQAHVASYDEAPAPIGDLAGALDQAAALAGEALSPELAGRLAAIRSQIAIRAGAHRTLLSTRHEAAVRAARSLRTVAASFADDGPDRAARALPALDTAGLLADEDRELLRRAAAWDEPGDPPFLADLAALRTRLLTRLGSDSRAVPLAPARDPEVQVLLHDIAEAAERHLGTEPDSVDDVLIDYLADLEGNIALVQETLSRYSAVLAATVQQTDSPAMYKVMDAPLPVFGTVIVDEAARANPLDLMIPMACARDRIILVGDHKQLPHAMERKIEQELQRTGKYMDTSRLQQSLFQRWFHMFRGTSKPVRTIRLSEQFRMHPELGRFVSSVFYGSPDAVTSHASTHALTHDLDPYRGKVAGWIDVPNGGRETRVSHSVVRRAEAKRVVQELVSLAGQDARRQVTFGIISFYKQQVAAIREELLDAGLLLPDDENPDEIRPVPRMQVTDEPNPRTRLRLGTVDAFQGMEFDVVLLSVTRSSPPDRGAGAAETALGRYGHLTSEQRMCVAMSRQRRLLLAVGDAAMADRATAPPDPASPGRSSVEGLVAFLELCEGPHGVVIRS